LNVDSTTIINDGSQQVTFRATGFPPNSAVVALLNGPDGTLNESAGTTDSKGTYSETLTYQGPYSGPATLSATDNLGDVSNVLNVTITP